MAVKEYKEPPPPLQYKIGGGGENKDGDEGGDDDSSGNDDEGGDDDAGDDGVEAAEVCLDIEPPTHTPNDGQATTAKIIVLLDNFGLLSVFQGAAQALVGTNRGTLPPSSLMEAWDLLSTQITQTIEAQEGAQDGGESKGVPKGDAAGPAAVGTMLSVFVETLVRLVYTRVWVPVCVA